MKTICIPKGRTAAYDTLEAEHLVVNGCLKVSHSLKARTISGSGVILAGTVSADGIHTREIEAAAVYCLRLNAKRVQAAEVFASESAEVSCFLCADYVAAGRLTVGMHEVGEIDAGEVVSLPPAKHVHPFRRMLSLFRSVFRTGEIMDAEYRQVREASPAGRPKTEPREEDPKHRMDIAA